MDSIILIAGLLFLVCPLIALFVAFSARSKAEAAEQSVARLKKELAQLRSQLSKNAAPAPTETEYTYKQVESTSISGQEPQAPAQPQSEPQPEPPLSSVTSAGDYIHEPLARSDNAYDAIRPVSYEQQAPEPVEPGPVATFVSGLATKAWQWLFGGNVVAKIGLLILFIGISFLLRFAAAHVVVPIELRLAGIVLADIGMLIWGWRIREKRAGISLPVQGAALAILMLVTFAAFRMYDLIPSGLAFGLLFILTGFTCLLAVLQNAVWLAIFGIAGGFAAPILTSTDEGSHIALFSYYALLNAGIFGIALKRAWRSLNLIGFVFTFLIGTTWGVLRYAPEHYLSTQLFLILFFVFYVAIATVYALQQAPRLKHYVDATLVFGTPVLAFGLQYGLVRHMPFGMAFSALATALFYMTLTLALWRHRGGTLKLLAESFFALSVVFGTLTIPLALDGRWTSAAWALEGAGIVWIGLRQRQTLAWVFGLLVQAGAWIAFIFSLTGLDRLAALQSNLWLGFLLLAATAFLMATSFRAQADDKDIVVSRRFGAFATVLLALASLWFVAGAWTEIWMRTSGATRATLLVASALLAATGLAFLARRMQWEMARRFALVAQLAAGLILLILAAVQLGWPFRAASPNLLDGPFLGALLIGAGAFFSAWVFERQIQTEPQADLSKLSRRLLLWSGFWWYGLVLYLLAGWIAVHYQSLWQDSAYRHGSLWACAYGIGLAISSPLLAHLARRLQWKDLRWSAAPLWAALAMLTGLILLTLYSSDRMPVFETWFTLLALWLAGEYLMHFWQRNDWPLPLQAWLHTIRTAGPWLMIWPVGHYWIATWLQEGFTPDDTSGSWSRYLPAWLMMLAIAWLMQCSRNGKWPVTPIAAWYRNRLIPLASGWAIVLVTIWNLSQDGAMAPLPYLPLLNPLDLTTCFAMLLGFAAFRLIQVDFAASDEQGHEMMKHALVIAGLVGYAWFNLVLLRSVAQYGGMPYRFDTLFASQFVQAMLSLVWSATALVLMRMAVQRASRSQWMLGAALLAVVVAKLFFVDLSNIGGVERIISFVGVGMLMVAIGYLAPYPTESDSEVPEPGNGVKT